MAKADDNDKKPKKKGKKPVKADDKQFLIDDNLRRKIINEEKDKLKKEADKLALQLQTKLDLETQVKLTDEQNNAAIMLASGYSFKEVADSLSVPLMTIEGWMKDGGFARQVNEYSIKEGVSDKNDRVRKTKRLVEEMHNALLTKILKGDLKNVSIKEINEMLLKQTDRLDKLLEKKDDLASKDLTVLILNYGKEKSAKDYSSLEDMLEDDEYKYPTLDIEAEEV